MPKSYVASLGLRKRQLTIIAFRSGILKGIDGNKRTGKPMIKHKPSRA
jgi:hypothetical protein